MNCDIGISLHKKTLICLHILLKTFLLSSVFSMIEIQFYANLIKALVLYTNTFDVRIYYV